MDVFLTLAEIFLSAMAIFGGFELISRIAFEHDARNGKIYAVILRDRESLDSALSLTDSNIPLLVSESLYLELSLFGDIPKIVGRTDIYVKK